jgi:Tfp pilus assembly protein PilE
MFRQRKARRAERRDDRGIAVVAAIGVAFILMMILTIVVAVTVATTNNSARDRARTASIHAAEGALDTTLAAMERDTVCDAPSFSPLTVGNGAQQSVVTIEIKYFSDEAYANEVICSGGALAGTATYATVTATAVPAHAVNGVQPSRTIEARLAVKSRGETAVLPGLYARYDLWLVGTPDVFSPSASSAPDIWVDTGKMYCQPTINMQLEIEADVVVAQGDAEIQEWCWFTRDVFIGRDMAWRNSAAPAGSEVHERCNNKFICGDLTVGRTLNIQGSPAERLTVGGNVTVGTSITPNTSRLVANGAVTVPATIQAKDARGFPTVEYVPANWAGAPYYMTEGRMKTTPVPNVNDLIKRLSFKSGYSMTNPSTTLSNCNFNSQYYNSTIEMPHIAMVYDLRDCNGSGSITVADVMKFSSTNTFKLYADTAFFVSGFFNSGTLNFVSGDGAEHRVWFIVADAGVPAYTNYTTCTSATLYSLCSTNILTSTANTPIMWYTKHLFFSDGKDNAVNDMYGQVFAGTIYFKGYLDLQFETLPIPHEVLWTAGDPGFDVQLLSKRELPTE